MDGWHHNSPYAQALKETEHMTANLEALKTSLANIAADADAVASALKTEKEKVAALEAGGGGETPQAEVDELAKEATTADEVLKEAVA